MPQILPFPWSLSFLMCVLTLWAIVCILSSFHMTTPMDFERRAYRMEIDTGWLVNKS